MLITTMSTPQLQDLVKRSFVQGVAKPAGQVRQIFHPATQTWETKHKSIMEVDREGLAEEKTEGASSAQRGMALGYSKQFTRKTISVTRKVSGEEFLALQAHDLSKNVTSVAKDLIDKIELDMRNFIGMGTASSYTDNGGYTIDTTVGDGLSLFNTTHTLKYSAKTYSNILSGAPSFSSDALESAEDYFAYNIMDNYGKRQSIKPNTIITADRAGMKNRVTRLLKSISPETVGGVANANSGVVNDYRDKYRHLVIEFDVDSMDMTDSSKSYFWFLASIGGSPDTSFQAYYIKWLSPMVAPLEVDQGRWTLSYTARSAYAIGAVSGKGILLSKALA